MCVCVCVCAFQIHGGMEQYGVEELKQDREHQSLLRETDEHQKSSESEALGYDAQTSTVSKTLDHIKTGIFSHTHTQTKQEVCNPTYLP